HYAWIIPPPPGASFFLILFFGKRLPRKGSEIGIAAVGLAFVLALVVNVDWYPHVDDAGPGGGGRARRRGRGWRVGLGGRPGPGRRRRRGGGRGIPRDRGARDQGGHLVRERRHRQQGRHAARRPGVDDAAARHAGVVAGPRVLDRLRARRPALHPLLRLPVAVHGVDARPGHSQDHHPAHLHVGAGGRVLVRAHRPLVGGEGQQRRRPQGLHHQPRG